MIILIILAIISPFFISIGFVGGHED